MSCFQIIDCGLVYYVLLCSSQGLGLGVFVEGGLVLKHNFLPPQDNLKCCFRIIQRCLIEI